MENECIINKLLAETAVLIPPGELRFLTTIITIIIIIKLSLLFKLLMIIIVRGHSFCQASMPWHYNNFFFL